MKPQGSILPGKSRVYRQWDSQMDKILSRVLLDQIVQGNKGDGDWKTQAYQAVVDQLRTDLAINVTRDNVKNRLRAWKKRYAVIADIQKRSGLSFWDEDKKMIVVTADNMSDWQSYCNDHPDARSYANTYIENWDDLVLLCAKDRAVGDGAEHYSEANASMADEDDMEDVGSASTFGNSSAHGSKSQGKKSNGEVSSESRKRAKKDSQVGDALYMVANSLSSYLQSKKKEEEPRYTGKEIYDVICEIPGLTHLEVAKAVMKYRSGDPEQFKLLLEIPKEDRRIFVECFL
ncbi:unnamed protein product, partial [Linum tenue]